MQFRIRVSGVNEVADDSADLLEWLNNEPELRGRVTREVKAPPPGKMGWQSDVLVAALSGGSVVALAKTVQVWLTLRKSDVTVELETQERKVKVTVTSVSDPMSVVKEVMGELEEEHGR